MFKNVVISVLFVLLALVIPGGALAAGDVIVFSQVTSHHPLGPNGERISHSLGGGLFTFQDGRRMQLTDDPTDSEPSFSADGRTITFVRGGDVWAMRADGSGQRRLTAGVEIDAGPLIAPNGRYVLFERVTGESRSHDLYTCDLHGGGAAHLLVAAPGDEREAAFSPDGRQIVYVRRNKGDKADIWSIRPSGLGMRRLTRTSRIDDFSPRYLGKTIAFTRGSDRNWRRPKTYAAIYTMDRRGGQLRRVVARAPSVRLKDVNARTRTMLFGRARGLWVKRLGGGARKFVGFPEGGSATAVFSPNGRRVAALTWKSWGQSLSVLDAVTGRLAHLVASATSVEGGESSSTIGPVIAWQPASHR